MHTRPRHSTTRRPQPGRGLLLLSLLLAGSASAGQTNTDPVGIVYHVDDNMPDAASLAKAPLKSLPKVYFLDMSQLRSAQQNCPKDLRCARYQYESPYLELKKTQELGQFMEKAWQEFQERTYWRVTVEVNKALAPVPLPPQAPWSNAFAQCTLPIGEAAASVLRGNNYINPALPSPKISVPTDGLMSDVKLPGGLKPALVANNLSVPFKLYPQVKTGAYCPGVTPEIIPDNVYPFVPTSIYQPSRQVNTPLGSFTVGKFPLPMSMNWPQVRTRAQNACNAAVRTYYPEYIKAVATEIAKTMPLGLAWDVTPATPGKMSGVMLAPVMDNTYAEIGAIGTAAKAGLRKPAITKFKHIAQIKDVALKTNDPRALTYFTKLGNSTPNATGTLRPGIKTLEDPKRFLPVLTLEEQGVTGIASLYQVWHQFDFVNELRPVTYWSYASVCAVTACAPTIAFPNPIQNMVITPAGCAVASTPGGTGTITYNLPRYHYRWVNVPETGAIPDVQGDPVQAAGGYDR